MESLFCKKCSIEKSKDEFYVAQKSECKDCVRKRVKERSELLKNTDPNYIEKERKRGRQKYHRLYRGTGKARPEVNRRYNLKYPEKYKVKVRCSNLIRNKPFMDAEIHHWSYNEEHWKDIIWLKKREHMKGHRFIVYDPERMMYRRIDTMELLDTREEHEAFFRRMIKTQEY